MSTLKTCQTQINLDALMKRVERIVDEQINEIANGKSKSITSQLMREDFAQGNPYSALRGQVCADDTNHKRIQNLQQRPPQNYQSSTVFSTLRTEEDRMAVVRLSERLKENIGRAIDEFSEGLCRQLRVAAGRNEEEVNPIMDEEKTMEFSTPVDQQNVSEEEDLALEVQALKSDNEVEAISAEILLQNEGKEAASSPDIVKGNAYQKENSASQNAVETKTFLSTSLEGDVTEEEVIPSQNEGKIATFSTIPVDEQNILPPQSEEKTETFSSTPAGEGNPLEEALLPQNEVMQASPSVVAPEVNSQQENPFKVLDNWGDPEPSSSIEEPDVNSEGNSISPSPVSEPSERMSLSETSKSIAVVNKTAAEMSQINQQRLSQYYTRKLSL